MVEKFPSITIVTGTLNSNLAIFRKMLDSVKKQNYPIERIEHLVMDGGSTNGCVELARQFGCNVIIRQTDSNKEQIRPAIGIQMAKGELILILESDNILPAKDWLATIVKPFIENDEVFCTYSAYNTYGKNMSVTTRYCALFGAPDPTLYYLRKTEKIPMDQRIYDRGKIVKETKDYYIVKFAKNNLPTLGDNGHLFSKQAMFEVISDPKEYIHTDAFMHLLERGYNTFGVVKNSIIHVASPHLFDLVGRRLQVKERFYDKKRGKRKYLVYNPNLWQDRWNLFKYIIFSLTFIQPLLVSIKGYLRIRDRAWFLHPVVCFLMVMGYAWSEVKFQLKVNT